ncbi:helix-turn-helix domain-containing protein [Neomicrococcus aestuarii]|uniref:Transcriptional regulator with XRE-family HTH domain n=1 Tax=Neomicrococcus aestuarii TaxID=556325 RepID=A0A1L2ZQT2_9MICC|nr:helix-turn-helix transcriptional regulator [Neomicrococcus aestuarii]APF41785.1 XRE family transcriptional regulator [Neomicrococcus aestuarii]MBB5512491.1 transcriptional regulator with XRE-family HTH domain [Neomicrococcus aestuarii]
MTSASEHDDVASVPLEFGSWDVAKRGGRTGAHAGGEAPEDAVDTFALGRRIRHLRKGASLTLDELAERVGTVASQLSLIENGRREPKISMLSKIAAALGTTMDDLLASKPADRRSELEIELERYQRGPLYSSLGLPAVKISTRTSMDVLEALVGLQRELERRLEEQVATPEEARRANIELRKEMRSCNNYYPELEAEARKVLDAVGGGTGPLSTNHVADIAAHFGFSLKFVQNLPHSTRSVTDLKNHTIYLTQSRNAEHDHRSVVLQALGHYVLGHQTPKDYSDFLRQRVYTNYFAAALLLPEQGAVALLKAAKQEKEISIDDLRDAFAVSYESAAHRFTNLATEHFGITTHFQKVHESGIIHKVYENDGVNFPSDHTGAIEGQTVCRYWTSRVVFDVADRFRSYNQFTDTKVGTYWCTARVEGHSSGLYSLSVGVPFEHVKWFRGRDTKERSQSTCPDESCCRRPPQDLAREWAGQAWPATRANAHLLAAMPTGAFPGVDQTEVYQFLKNQELRG